MSNEKIPVLNSHLCTQCGECVSICPENAIVYSSSSQCAKCIKYCISLNVPCDPDYSIIIYEKCNSCGKCVEACKAGAISWQLLEDVDAIQKLKDEQ